MHTDYGDKKEIEYVCHEWSDGHTWHYAPSKEVAEYLANSYGGNTRSYYGKQKP